MATVLTNAGKTKIAERLKGTGNEPSYLAWGTGAGTAAATDTTLFTEASESRVAGTSSIVTVNVTNDTYQLVGTITADGSKTITNAGNFDAAAAGNICVHGDFTGVSLAVGESIQFTIKIVMA